MTDPRVTVLRSVFHGGGRYPGTPVALVPDQPNENTVPVYWHHDGPRHEIAKSLRREVVGHAWSDIDDAPPGVESLNGNKGGVGYVVRTDNTRAVTAGAHELTFDLHAGGSIRSWKRSTVELLNAGPGRIRGIQSGFEWTDHDIGEFVRHFATQGGIADSESGAVADDIGSPCYDFKVTDHGTSQIIESWWIPLESDPGGDRSIPGVSSNHGGRKGNPVLWEGLRGYTKVEVNLDGVADWHRITTRLLVPFDIETSYFNVGIHLAAFLRADLFGNVWAWDRAAGGQAISDGTPATLLAFGADYRRYMMNRTLIFGDNEPVTGASKIGSGIGGVLGRENLLGTGAAFFVGNALSQDSASLATNLSNFPKGNGVVWLQNRAGASTGHLGTDTVCLAHGAWMTSRFHSPTAVRRVDKGTELSLSTYIATGDYNTVNARLAASLA